MNCRIVDILECNDVETTEQIIPRKDFINHEQIQRYLMRASNIKECLLKNIVFQEPLELNIVINVNNDCRLDFSHEKDEDFYYSGKYPLVEYLKQCANEWHCVEFACYGVTCATINVTQLFQDLHKVTEVIEIRINEDQLIVDSAMLPRKIPLWMKRQWTKNKHYFSDDEIEETCD